VPSGPGPGVTTIRRGICSGVQSVRSFRLDERRSTSQSSPELVRSVRVDGRRQIADELESGTSGGMGGVYQSLQPYGGPYRADESGHLRSIHAAAFLDAVCEPKQLVRLDEPGLVQHISQSGDLHGLAESLGPVRAAAGGKRARPGRRNAGAVARAFPAPQKVVGNHLLYGANPHKKTYVHSNFADSKIINSYSTLNSLK